MSEPLDALMAQAEADEINAAVGCPPPVASQPPSLVRGRLSLDEVRRRVAASSAKDTADAAAGAAGVDAALAALSEKSKKPDAKHDEAKDADLRPQMSMPKFKQDWPSEILCPRGLVGDVVAFIRDAAGVPQPKFALAAGLTVCGALLGRGVKDFTGQRTNLFTLAVGGTSAGKNDPIRTIGKIVDALGQRNLLAGEVTSDSALEILIEVFPVRLFLLDEIGQYLTTMKGAGQSNGHLRTVIPALTKCWSAAGGTFYGKSRAKDGSGQWKPPKQIDEPCVCLYGTSAPEVLFDAMSDADFSDGSVPRFIPFISESRPQYVAKPEIIVPDILRGDLGKALRTLRIPLHGVKSQVGTAMDIPNAILVGESEDAAKVFAGLEQEKQEHMVLGDNGDPTLYLWGKSVENARRIALIVATFRNPSAPCVERVDAEYACDLMRLSVSDMVSTVRDRVAGSKVERDKKKLRFIIRKSKGGITKSELTRRTQTMRPNEREEALFDLVEAGEIEERTEAGNGRKFITRYVFCAG